jgi:hypothetical protein
MNRIGIAAGILLALSTSACVDADATLLMKGPVFAECKASDTGGVSCLYVGDDAIGVAEVLTVNLGDLDQGQAPGGGPNIFTIGVAMTNRLLASDAYAPIGEQNNLRVDQNPIIIDSFQISFPSDSNLGGVDSLDNEYRYVVDVPTGDGSAGAAIVPALVNVQAFGTTIGGQEVESNIVGIPLNVCLGCTYGSSAYGTLEQ